MAKFIKLKSKNIAVEHEDDRIDLYEYKGYDITIEDLNYTNYNEVTRNTYKK